MGRVTSVGFAGALPFNTNKMAIHNIPHNDIEPHVRTSTCKCSPKVRFENDVMIVTHNSFDGREALEDYMWKHHKYTVHNGEWWVVEDDEFIEDMYNNDVFDIGNIDIVLK